MLHILALNLLVCGQVWPETDYTLPECWDYRPVTLPLADLSLVFGLGSDSVECLPSV